MTGYPETKFCTKKLSILGKTFQEVYRKVLLAKTKYR